MTLSIHSPAALPPRAPDGPADGRHGAERLRHEIEAARDASPVYQLLQRALGESGVSPSNDPAPADDPRATQPAADNPAIRRADAGAAVAAPVRVEAGLARTDVHVARLTIAENRVQLTWFDLTLERARIEAQAGPPVRRSDPLALDLAGTGLATTGIEDGVRFDIDADGRLDRVSVAAGGSAFVAHDRNGNGRIDDGRELFGDQHGHANGFEALRGQDHNRDGAIDARDPVFEMLRLVQLQADGSQRLTTLAAAGVASISLDWQPAGITLNAYDSVAQLGRYTRVDGSGGTAGDLLLGFRAAG